MPRTEIGVPSIDSFTDEEDFLGFGWKLTLVVASLMGIMTDVDDATFASLTTANQNPSSGQIENPAGSDEQSLLPATHNAASA